MTASSSSESPSAASVSEVAAATPSSSSSSASSQSTTYDAELVGRLRRASSGGSNDGAGAASSGDVWQLDFGPRPILDARGKKMWELLLCDETGAVRVSEFFSNTMVNSGALREALRRSLDEASNAGVPRPKTIRYFRAQMRTVISRACAELGVEVEASRRCEALLEWMQERLGNVYSQHEGFDEAALRASEALEAATSQPVPGTLPDALAAESWLFVQLPLGMLVEECEVVQRGETFGRIARLTEDVGSADMVVPGLCMYSPRSGALAAYMMSYDLFTVYPDVNRLTLVLGSGLNDLYRFGAIEERDVGEAEAWEDAKRRANGVHFLAVSPDEQSDKVDGFWLLQERDLPAF